MLAKVINKYNKYKPTINDIFNFIWLFIMKNRYKLLGTLMFYLKVKLFGIKLNGKIKCYGKIELIRFPMSIISFGKNVNIISDSYRSSASSLYSCVKLQTFSPTSLIQVGDNVDLNGTSIVARSKKVIIGNGTIIAPNVIIMDSDFHSIWPAENRGNGIENDSDVVIGENVWIGLGTTILKGVVIGDNSIIGAGSVVTGIVPSNVIYAGNPAKFIKSLGDNI